MGDFDIHREDSRKEFASSLGLSWPLPIGYHKQLEIRSCILGGLRSNGLRRAWLEDVTMNITERTILQQLQCTSLPDSTGRKPYLWPALIAIDIASQNGLPAITIIPPEADENGTSGFLLSNDMHAGDSVDIPSFAGALGHLSNDGFPRRNLIVLVTLWEHHDFPQGAIDAGYNAYLDSLLFGIATNLTFLDNADVVQGIAQNVQTAVTSAIKDALPTFFTGAPDIPVGFNSLSWMNPTVGTSPFSFPILSAPSGPMAQYVIQGQLEISADHCTAEQAAVTRAQLQIDQIQASINVLNQEWQHASPGMRTYILQQRRKLDAELGAARAELEKTKKALTTCQILSGVTGGTGPGRT